MTYPTSPTNGQKFTRADGTVMTFSSASQSWTKDPPTGVPPTETLVDTIGTTSVTIPVGAKKARVKACAGGASGQPAGTGTNPENNIGFAAGVGGGSGYGVEFMIDLTGVSALSVTVGAGGTSSTSSGSAGGNTALTFTGKGTITLGGAPTPSSIPTASPTQGSGLPPGSSPAENHNAGGNGGVLVSNTISGLIVIGGSEGGGRGIEGWNGRTNGRAGDGGSGTFGRGGNGAARTSNGASAGSAASGYGAGGGGAFAKSTSGGQGPSAGGSGAKGFAYFEWIF